MRTPEHRRLRLTDLSVLVLAVALFLFCSAIVAGQPSSESWNEKASDGGLPGGVPTPAATDDSPTPKPPPTNTPLPTNTPIPSPTPKPTPKISDFKTAREYACQVVKDDPSAATAVDKGTGETAVDKARRDWESAERVKKGGKPIPPPDTKVPGDASPYMKACAAEGVPLPPPWGDPRWVKQEPNLPTNQTFASSLPTTEVWVSRTPNGVCYALPRINSAGTIILMGQICQSNGRAPAKAGDEGKACFWDNKDPNSQPPPPTPQAGVAVTNGLNPKDLAGGEQLQENCTECHRGDNVFNIHPGTALELDPIDPCASRGSGPFPTDTKANYRPVVGPTPAGVPTPYTPRFTNPGAESGLKGPGKGCNMCHSIPQLSAAYCGTLLGVPTPTPPPAPTPTRKPRGMIPTGEMPPPGMDDADTAADIKTLTAKCKKILGIP